MDFGKALSYLKKGEKVARNGWNGKGQFVVLQKGYPEGIPCNKQTAEAWGLKEGDLFRCEPYLQIKTTNESHSMWVPSISDVLAEDWVVVGTDAKKPDEDKPTEPISKTVVHVDKDKGVVAICGNDPDAIEKAMDAIAEMLGVEE